MIATGFFDELEKLAVGQGSFAQAMKQNAAGRTTRNVFAAVEKKLRASKHRPLRAAAYTLNDMSMSRALSSAALTSPAMATPIPLAHPAAMMAVNAPAYMRQYQRLGAQS